MISPKEILETARPLATPFYLYDMDLLDATLREIKRSAACNDKFRVSYAMKACNELPVLRAVRAAGLGLDTVSGGEIEMALKAGFSGQDIMFAGVGKTDREIDLALKADILAFNVESMPELEVIDQRAALQGKTARVALRVNPDIDAHTHHYITTGLEENKFGINQSSLDKAVDMALSMKNVEFYGLHFHIGSQITTLEPFKILCERANRITDRLRGRGIKVRSLNLGGGLAIDYDNPRRNPVADFAAFFETINSLLDTALIDEVHFELGRAVVGQTGFLITRVVYVKEGDSRTFVITDGGMTELIRPALYEARHPIENVSGMLRGEPGRKVDVVGPVCESADVFGRDYTLAEPRRGDVLAVGCAGAYGQVMSSRYNARTLNPSVFVGGGKDS